MISLRRSARAYPVPAITNLDQLAAAIAASGQGANRMPTTMGSLKTEAVPPGFEGFARAMAGCPPAFAAQQKRAAIIGETRLAWKATAGKDPGKLFGNPDLAKFERPWPGGKARDLFTRMEWHAGPAGNAYVIDQGTRLRLLRPDWVAVLYGSQDDPDSPLWATDAEVLGYVYQPGGLTGAKAKAQTFLPDQVAHWAPLPDPLSVGQGMSWLTPVIREIQNDRMATEHKLKYFENGATPNMVVKGITSLDGQPLTPKSFQQIVDMLEDQHAGIANAYKSLYLTAGADATVVGSNMKDLDYAALQAKGENRIAVAASVPAPILGISEGFAGSGLQSGFYQAAKRAFADTWYTPQAGSLAGCLEKLARRVPDDAELSFDPAANQFLQEDRTDEAEINAKKIEAIRQAVEAGYDPDVTVEAVVNNDLKKLIGSHTGLTSVQLQPPNQGTEAKSVHVPTRDVADLLAQGWTIPD